MSSQAPTPALVSPALVCNDEPGLQLHLPNPKPPGALNGNFWILYASSFLIDFGLCLYFFMFSLFLVEHHFQEHSIGLIAAALTVGTIAGTLPASFLSRRLGLRTMMLAYTLLAPLCLAARTLFLQMPAQIGLAFLTGVAMSIWSVCFSPTLAKLTTQKNRAFGFSLFIATGIGSGALGGLVGGYLPRVFDHPGRAGAPVDGIRIVLLLACAILSLASFGLFRLRLEAVARTGSRAITGFLVRFAVAIGVWNFALGFFTPFANVYLATHLKVSLPRIGLIYTASQLFQIAAVLMAPLIYRKVGLVAGIALTQIGTAAMLWGLSHASGTVRGGRHLYIAYRAAMDEWSGHLFPADESHSRPIQKPRSSDAEHRKPCSPGRLGSIGGEAIRAVRILRTARSEWRNRRPGRSAVLYALGQGGSHGRRIA